MTTSPPEVTKLAVKSAMTQNVDILLILPKGNSKLENVKELLPTTTQFKGEFRQLDEMVKSMIEPSEIWMVLVKQVQAIWY